MNPSETKQGVIIWGWLIGDDRDTSISPQSKQATSCLSLFLVTLAGSLDMGSRHSQSIQMGHPCLLRFLNALFVVIQIINGHPFRGTAAHFPVVAALITIYF